MSMCHALYTWNQNAPRDSSNYMRSTPDPRAKPLSKGRGAEGVAFHGNQSLEGGNDRREVDGGSRPTSCNYGRQLFYQIK